jgi:hypothetical protein
MAEHVHTTPKTRRAAAKLPTDALPLPNLGPAFQRTVDKLKEMAARGGDALYLSDGRTVPDWQLLDASAEVLSIRKRWKLADDEHRAIIAGCGAGITDAVRQRWAEVVAEKGRLDRAAHQVMRGASKMRATTPAGIYAKALMVRCYHNCAGALAKDLADELIACTELRTALWPAVVEGASLAGGD